MIKLKLFLWGLAATVALAAAGCALLGVGASLLPDPTIAAKYKGLTGQKVAVMVWTDHALAIDWPTLQLDLGRGITSRLQDLAQNKDHPTELNGTKFVSAESVVRYQHDHPEADAEAIADVAPRLGVSRLIYLEVEDFATRPEDSIELYRGSITANLKVLEVDHGKAKLAFDESNIHVVYPDKGPEEGSPGLGDPTTYEQTLNEFTVQIVNRFVPHQEERK